MQEKGNLFSQGDKNYIKKTPDFWSGASLVYSGV